MGELGHQQQATSVDRVAVLVLDDISNAVALRDSKNSDGGYILVSREDFRRFIEALKQL